MKDLGSKIIYELYPTSFYDSNNDGVGDVRGIIKKLDYLQELGIDLIWLTPIFVSPKNDNGYDVANYYDIDPSFGTMKDVEELISEAKKRNIGIMFDMVFNHISTEHEWFKKAIKGSKKHQDYFYIIPSETTEAPNNWVSKFGGSAWEYRKEFNGHYLHLFDKTQIDINWNNEDVRKEVCSIVNFWIEKGVKGFRFDVINLIGKPKKFKSTPDFGKFEYTDKKSVHGFLKMLNKNSFGKDDEIITVGEMSSTTIKNCIKYTNPKEHELDMVFNFHHLKVDYKDGQKWANKPWDKKEFKNIIEEWQLKMQKKGWNAVFLNNHDQPRVNTRYGNTDKYWFESSTLFATLIFALRGTVFLYQGEEIGMTDPGWNSIKKYKDVESINAYKELKEKGLKDKEIMEIIKVKSRDNSRTPMQWSDEKYAGFSKKQPWIDVADNYKKINVKNQLKDKNSVFNFYKKLISIRKENNILSKGNISFDKTVDDLFVINREYNNQKIKIILNLSENKIDPPVKDINNEDIIINNYKSLNNKLKPFQAVMIKDNK